MFQVPTAPHTLSLTHTHSPTPTLDFCGFVLVWFGKYDLNENFKRREDNERQRERHTQRDNVNIYINMKKIERENLWTNTHDID